MTKAQYASQVQTAATTLADAITKCNAVSDVFTDRGYASNGSNPIVDADVAVDGITAAQLQAFITLVTATVQPFYTANHATINRMRTDI